MGKTVIAVIAFFVFSVWALVRIMGGVTFDQNCGGYLGRAANANTVEMAKKELNVALRYMESNRLTDGYTSIWYRTPDEDIGFWYRNVKAARDELDALPPTTTALEKTNVLLKLRETLMDQNGVTVPSGISIYPHNGFVALLSWVSGLILIIMLWLILRDKL